MKNCPNIIVYIYFLNLFFSIGQIILFIFQFINNENIYELYPSLVHSWIQHPIEEIKKVYFLEDCDINQGYIPIFNYKWPGTQEGCLCSDGTIFRGICCCGEDCAVETCCGDEIEANDPVSLNTWEFLQQPLKLCGKIMEGLTFSDILPQYSDKICLENEQQCGKGKKQVCIDKQKKCPINKIRWKQLEAEDNTNDFEKLEIYPEIYLYYSRNQEAYPITQFRVNENSSVCFDQTKVNINPESQRKYSPLILNTEVCNSNDTIDDSFVNLASITEQSLFIYNGIYSFLSSLNDYKFEPDSKYSLFYKSYTETNCPEQIQKLIHFENNSRRSFYDIGLLIIIIGSIYIFHLAFLNPFFMDLIREGNVLQGIGINIFDNGNNSKGGCYSVVKVYSFFITLIYLTYLFFNIYQLAISIELENLLAYQTKNNCFSQNYVAFINKLDRYNNLGIVITLNITCYIQFFLEPNIHQLILIICKRLRFKRYNQVQNNNRNIIQLSQNREQNQNNKNVNQLQQGNNNIKQNQNMQNSTQRQDDY